MSEPPADAPVCIDASVVAGIVLAEEVAAACSAAWRSWIRQQRPLVGPPHLAAEALSAVRRAGLQGRLTQNEETDAIRYLVEQILPGISTQAVSPEVLVAACAQARQLRCAGIYDTLYLALAEHLGAEFWTADANLIRALQADGRPLPEWVHLLEPEQPAAV